VHIYKRNARFFRLAKDTKRPLMKNWQEIHITWDDARHIIKREGGGFGFAIPESMIVIDVDPRNGGALSYMRLLTMTGMPDLSEVYPTVQTPGGGFHFYMILRQDDIINTYGNSKEFPGIDVKRVGGYVVTAHSRIFDKTYTVINDPKKCPYVYRKLLEPFKRTPIPPQRPKHRIYDDGTISGEKLRDVLSNLDARNYGTNDLWFPILCAAYNATDGDGLEEFIEWSTSDPRFANRRNDIAIRWRSLELDRDNKITLGTILHEINKTKPDEFGDSSIYIDAVTKEFAKTYNPEAINDVSYTTAHAVLNEHALQFAADDRYWIYEQTHWKPLSITYVKKFLLEAYHATGETKSSASVIDAAERILRPTVAERSVPGKVDANENSSVVNVKNGELWIENNTGRCVLKGHTPSSNLIYCLPIEYQPKAQCPIFDKVLLEIFSNDAEMVRHLWEIFGFTIQTKKDIATIVLFLGRGSNGKSLILHILSALLGPAALPVQIADLDGSNSHALASLPGKLAVIDDDIKARSVLPDNMLKKLSENNELEANPKFATPYVFTQISTPWLSANMLPRTNDLTGGLKRRIQVFQFLKTFSHDKRDNNLRWRIIENELPGVLNRALEGLARLRKRGFYSPPAKCEAHKDRWYAGSDSVFNFVRDKMTRNITVMSPTKLTAIWDAYNGYVVDTGIKKPMNLYQLIEGLENCGVPVVRCKSRTYMVYTYRLRSDSATMKKGKTVQKMLCSEKSLRTKGNS
jgi:P4 family phage/plasmid primase-like protien